MRNINLLGFPIGLLLVAVLLVAVLPSPMVMADETPIACWGTVTIDGVAAQDGTVVKIYIGDDTAYSAITSVDTDGGKYPPGTYTAVSVTAGESRYGTPLTYKVNGVVANKQGPDEGVFGLKNQVVNLAAISGSKSHTWSFPNAGMFPRHLPDTFNGQVVLDNLSDVPGQVQGVYWFDDDAGVWDFWAPGAPGCKLTTLQGGHTYDYVVSVTELCQWAIPLQ